MEVNKQKKKIKETSVMMFRKKKKEDIEDKLNLLRQLI